MGFLNLFRGKEDKKTKKKKKKGANAHPADLSPWAQRIRDTFEDAGHFENAPKAAVCSDFLGQLLSSVEGGKIKKLSDDDEVELRARLEGIPVRVNIEYGMGWVNLESKVENRRGEVSLERDHEKIPKSKEDDDDDWADDDELRVFIAKGIFVEGWENEISESFATMEQLPADFLSWLTSEMDRLEITRVAMQSESVSIGFKPNIDEMKDPVKHVEDGLAALAAVSKMLASGNGGAARASQPAVASQRVQCSYCSTLFVLDARHDCPNCAAPYRGA